MTVEVRLRMARESVKLSQSELAEKIGMSEPSIQRYEKNAKSIPLHALIEIARETKTELSWIAYGEAKEIATGVKIAQLIRRIEKEDPEVIGKITDMAEAILLQNYTKKNMSVT
jgi:transcriptional regulator with XRE-family HTH domain